MEETYSLRLVTQRLKELGMLWAYHSGGGAAAWCLREHGCKIELGERFFVSVQTHPLITGSEFAETCVLEPTTKRRGDCVRHATPEALITHLLDLKRGADDGQDPCYTAGGSFEDSDSDTS